MVVGPRVSYNRRRSKSAWQGILPSSGEYISLRFGRDLLDIVPVQRHWRSAAVEENANAAVQSTAADDDTFLFGKAWVSYGA